MQTDTFISEDVLRQSTEPDRFDDLLAAMQRQIDTLPGAASPRLYRVDHGSSLWSLFLSAIPEHRRQHYNCRTCRQFVERYGDLVYLDADGQQHSAVWPDMAEVEGLRAAGQMSAMLACTVGVVRTAVRKAPIVAVFYEDSTVLAWGTPEHGRAVDGTPWTHLAVRPPNAIGKFAPPAGKTAHQTTAERTADREILARSLAEFPRDLVARAHGHLKAGQLYRSEIAEQIAGWMLALHDRLAATPNARHRDNLVWQAAATAPAGFCHVRSSMLGTLLEDLAAGLPFADVARRWQAKTHPPQYQRPQAPPSEGNVRRAEQVFAELGLAPALRRRYATIEEVLPHALWAPAAEPSLTSTAPAGFSGGVFSHLTRKGASPSPTAPTGPAVTLTFDKFRRTVLPTAASIELVVPSGRQPFAALVTAADPDAPPIVQWDRPDRRNPVTWYIHGTRESSGNLAREWNLTVVAAKVTAICLAPHAWDGGEGNSAYQHHGDRAFILLEGCRDTLVFRGGGLFPSHLRGDLREVRATIEAHSNAAKIEGADKATACGLMLQAVSGVDFSGRPVPSRWDHTLRVRDRSGVVTAYKLDRWD